MVDEIDKKFSCKVFSQTLKKDFLEKLVMPEIVSIIGEGKFLTNCQIARLPDFYSDFQIWQSMTDCQISQSLPDCQISQNH